MKYNHNVIIGIIYRSPNSSASIFNKELDAILSVTQTEKKYAYVIGDFNLNTYKNTLCSQLSVDADEFSNLLLSYHYYPMIVKPALITSSASSPLVNINTNVPCIHNGHSSGILLTDISDHNPVFTLINVLKHDDNTNKFVHRRNIYNKNIANFRRSLKCLVELVFSNSSLE